jgi:hypothetical protein
LFGLLVFALSSLAYSEVTEFPPLRGPEQAKSAPKKAPPKRIQVNKPSGANTETVSATSSQQTIVTQSSHLQQNATAPIGVDTSQLTHEEKRSIEMACSTPKSLYGPAAYNACLKEKLEALSRQGSRPDTSQLTHEEKRSIEMACSTPKSLYGPAAYNACLKEKLEALSRQGSRPDTSQLTHEEKRSIEMACSTPKSLYGPAAYNACLKEKLRKLNR